MGWPQSGAWLGRGSLRAGGPPMAEHGEHDDPWYIELAESVPIWVYVILVSGATATVEPGRTLTRRAGAAQFLLPIIASFVQIFREEAERKERKRR